MAQDGASEVDLFNALLNSKQEEKKEVKKIKQAPKEIKRETETYNCTSDEQTSLPLKMFVALLRNSGNGIDVDPGYQKETVRLSGSESMVGNCASMLEPTMMSPGENTPWAFMVKVKGCGKSECEYTVREKVNGRITSKTMKFVPNLQGFVKCMEATGVMKDGVIQDGQNGTENKVVDSGFSEDFSGINKSGELMYASYGPLANQLGLLYSDKNEYPGNKCFVYEKIKEDKVMLYSYEDAKYRNKYDIFQKVCKSGDWEKIDESIGDFKQFKWMQDILVKVRNELILKDVKKLAIKLDDTKDYRDLEDSEIKVIDIFKEKVVDYEINQIDKLYREYLDADDNDKATIKKKLQAKIVELQRLKESPFLQKKHLDMLSI
jgi:hypothetical protein